MKKRIFRLNHLIIFVLSLAFGSMTNAQERITKSINKDWKFSLQENHIDYDPSADISWQHVNIPHTWNDKDIQSGDEVHYGWAWYQKDLSFDSSSIDQQHFLRFEGVGQFAKLYINQKYVGEHLGSYSAFTFNITEFLVFDTINTILLEVNNLVGNSYPKDNFLFGIFGGIYRDVKIISTHEIHIGLCDYASSGVFVHPEEVNNDHASLKIISQLKNETSNYKKIILKNRLLNRELIPVAESTEEIRLNPGGLIPFTSYLQVSNPHLWNGKKDPYLYQLETEIIQDNMVTDKISQTIGIRYFDIDPDQGFILNGDTYPLYGVCRHQEWEDLGNALLPKHHKLDMDLIKELGANSIRLAHYQQADYIYSLADSMGLLIWAEIPFVNGYKEGADANAMQQLTELIKQNYNHPSIFVWGLHNEVIKNGVVTPAVNLSRQLHHLAKDLDPSRFTVSVSNIWWIRDHPIHELADLQGFNQYTGWYGGKPHELSNWIKNYHEKKPDIRISISEYGAGGNISHQTNEVKIPESPSPTGQFFPESYQTYYHEMTYAAIEKAPFIWSSYVWNMFDFSVPEWNRGGIKGRNHKGLITYDREIKKDAFYWYKANWSEEPVLYLTAKRNNNLNTNKCIFKAYCNFANPELFINGKSYGKMDSGINLVQFISKEIKLKAGEYQIQIKAKDQGKSYQDEYTLKVN